LSKPSEREGLNKDVYLSVNAKGAHPVTPKKKKFKDTLGQGGAISTAGVYIGVPPLRILAGRFSEEDRDGDPYAFFDRVKSRGMSATWEAALDNDALGKGSQKTRKI